jgi:hypothetical protein
VEESSRKEHEYNKSANEYRNRYEKECAAMGIPGHDVKTELRGLVSELPKLLDEVAALLQSSDTVEKAYQYYRAFVHYTASVPSGARITFYCFLYFIFIYLNYLFKLFINVKFLLHYRRRGTPRTSACAQRSCASTRTAMNAYRPAALLTGEPIKNTAHAHAHAHAHTGTPPYSLDWRSSTYFSGAQGAAPTINWDLGAEADVVEGGEAPAIDWSAISLDEPAAGGDDSTVSAPAAISWDISVEVPFFSPRPYHTTLQSFIYFDIYI